MKKVHILVILTAAFLVLSSQAAQAISDAGVLYLRVAAGARAGGMGEAFVSIADDATATYWNPAGLGNAPISGMLHTEKFPERFGEISDVITLDRKSGGGEQSWFIAGDQLVMYNGNEFTTGKDYYTSSDQTLDDFLNSIITITDENQAEIMARRIIEVNCPVAQADVETFIETVRGHLPEDYGEIDDLNRGLDSLLAGYKLCLLKADQFRELQGKLRDGLKDSTLSTEEIDRITFSLDGAVMRFLPSRLRVPYTASIDGTPSVLGAIGDYLWVGTESGLYRLSGYTWARYTTAEGLPGNDIRALASAGDHLLIGTDMGLAQYFHGSFTTFDGLPAAVVSAITMKSPTAAYAVIGDVLYYYDGLDWKDGFEYTVRIDDTVEKLADRIAIYHTPSEIQYLADRIREMNAAAVAEDAADVTGMPEVETPDETVADAAVEPPADAPADETADAPADVIAEGEVVAETIDDSITTDEPAVLQGWLSEGRVIRLPYSSSLRYAVNVMGVDVNNTLWVGTESGLLSFDGREWRRYGYDAFSVPAADSGSTLGMTAHEIARRFVGDDDPDKADILAENIDEYNELNGHAAEPGRTVYVYNWNTGASIQSIGFVFGELYVGTEYGLERLAESGWEAVTFADLDDRTVVASYDHKGNSYFVASDGITTESKGKRELVLMHVNWLPSLDLDMYYDFVSYVHHVRGMGTFGLSAIYLNYGKITFTDASGKVIDEANPFEIAIALSYGTAINSKLKLGMTGRFIHSRLSEQGVGEERGEGIASTFSVDAGILYKISDRLQFGAAITNLGPDITYIDADQSDALPRNLGFGLSYKAWESSYNSLIVQAEVNKMLVNMDNGFAKELEYAIKHVGLEYWYSNFIAARVGYKHDEEGEVKHMTFGAGLQLDMFRLDFAYVPSSIDSPLANTLRISLTGSF